jgi:hypothetical protein
MAGAEQAAEQRQQHRLEHDRHHHRQAAETERAHGGDLARAPGDRRIHRVQAPKHAPIAMIVPITVPRMLISLFRLLRTAWRSSRAW